MQNELSQAAKSLGLKFLNGPRLATESGLNLASREVVSALLDGLLSCLLPGIFTRENIDDKELPGFLQRS